MHENENFAPKVFMNGIFIHENIWAKFSFTEISFSCMEMPFACMYNFHVKTFSCMELFVREWSNM